MLLAIGDYVRACQRQKRSRVTIGKITNVEMKNHGRYDYEYVVNGAKFYGGEIVAGNLFTGTGHRIRVTYDSRAPQISTLTSFSEIGTRPVPVLFCALVCSVWYVRLRARLLTT